LDRRGQRHVRYGAILAFADVHREGENPIAVAVVEEYTVETTWVGIYPVIFRHPPKETHIVSLHDLCEKVSLVKLDELVPNDDPYDQKEHRAVVHVSLK
jgi:hypothetical protein